MDFLELLKEIDAFMISKNLKNNDTTVFELKKAIIEELNKRK